MNATIEWLAARLKEKTTWGAILAVAGLAGIHFDATALGTAITAIGAAICAATKEK